MKVYCKLLLVTALAAFSVCVQAQSVTFDFDNAPQHAPLPLYLTAGGITGHFSSGSPLCRLLYPGSRRAWFYSAGFRRSVHISQHYLPVGPIGLLHYTANQRIDSLCPEEYATDSSCTMRMTAYLGMTYVGTNTYQIPNPGTWPSGTLSFSSISPFDNIVIHYDAPPPTGGDYGPIFMVDNLVVTPGGGTPTPTPTATATPTATPTSTATPTPTSTPTPTPCTGRCTPTPRPRPTPAPRP